MIHGKYPLNKFSPRGSQDNTSRSIPNQEVDPTTSGSKLLNLIIPEQMFESELIEKTWHNT